MEREKVGALLAKNTVDKKMQINFLKFVMVTSFKFSKLTFKIDYRAVYRA